MNQVPKRQRIKGTVVSDKMDKTVVVEVVISKRHAKYQKSYRIAKRFKAHDPKNEYHTGDEVSIEATRPISKQKKFQVVGKAN